MVLFSENFKLINYLFYFSRFIHLSGKRISQADLLLIPSFVRLNTIELDYLHGLGLMKKRCELVPLLLRSITHTLNGAKMEFWGAISCRLVDFIDNLTLLTHLEKELLPICNNCRGYKFKIHFYSDHSSLTKVIATILQFGQIADSSNVSFNFDLHDEWPTELPIDAIANLLSCTHNFDAINSNGRAKQERLLEIRINDYIHNVSKMLNSLKTVKYFLTISDNLLK